MPEGKRVLVTGFPECGKTTLTGFFQGPVIHLDDLMVRGDTKKTRENILGTLENRKQWVAEGCQGLQFLPDLLPLVDVIIFVHGGDPKKFKGGYRWWIRLRRMLRESPQAPLFYEVLGRETGPAGDYRIRRAHRMQIGGWDGGGGDE